MPVLSTTNKRLVMKTKRSLLVLAATLGGPLCAVAQTSEDRPWFVGVSQEFRWESNILNTPSNELSDTLSATSLFGGANARFGRQRLRGDLALTHARYRRLSERDTDGWRAGVALDWETVGRLSGTVAARSQRQQAEPNVGVVPQVSLSNVERSDEIEARARLGGTALLVIEGGVGHRRVDFSAPEFAWREYRQDNVDGSVSWRPSDLLTLSLGASAAQTDYQAPAPGDIRADASDRRSIDLGARWVVSGASSLSGRLSATREDYERATAQDFSGVTGFVTWNWQPTGKLSLATTLARDTGQELSFLRDEESARITATDFARVSNRLSVNAGYEATAKIRVNAGLTHLRRSLVDTVSGARGRDNSTALTVGARWAATRTVTIGCSAGRVSRSASGAGSNDYDNDTAGCYAALTID
jgi:hypothetical protein